MQNPAAQSFEKLLTVMAELREQCPWDRKQTIHTLRQQTVEEVYELADAIDRENWTGIKEELGDLLLHAVFYNRIAEEQNAFTTAETIDALVEKLIYRHPHIYGDAVAEDDGAVKRNWEALKAAKKGTEGILSGVPKAMPALPKAMRLQEKAKSVGFEWNNTEEVWNKLDEELGELRQAVKEGEPAAVKDELGDVLFSLVNLSRFLGVDAESALSGTNAKFIRRFERMEALSAGEGKTLHDLDLAAMDALWNRAKVEGG